MAEYLNKAGSVTYTVITDTHGYPWGAQSAEIDLGDNTLTDSNEIEPIQPVSYSKIQVYGNHDVAQLEFEGKATRKGLQAYADTVHKVLLIGLDCAERFKVYKITSEDIVAVAEALKNLATDWDVIILTHVPLFPACSENGGCWGPEEMVKWDRVNESIKETDADIENNWMGSPRKLIKILAAFQSKTIVEYGDETYDYRQKTTNNLIGCFCGHIHNSVKCAVALNSFAGEEGITLADITKLYMEAFRTNGATEYDTVCHDNGGLYIPDPSPCQIIIDFDNHTVNGTNYVTPSIEGDCVMNEGGSGKPAGTLSTGTHEMLKGNGYYPKFYQGRCLGWSESETGGVTGIGNNYYTLGSVYVHGIGMYVNRIRFSASGLLKYYYKNSGSVQTQIPNYASADI